MNKEIKKIYAYNISNVDKELTFYELLTLGGTCEHWAGIYGSIGESLGYHTKLVQFPTGEIQLNKNKKILTSHVFAVWSNDDGYVILDQKKIFAFHFGAQSDEEIIEAINGKQK